MAAAGSNLLVGAPGVDGGGRDAGAAYLFSGQTGRLIRTFTNPSPTAGEQFGAAVAAGANGLLLIGAPFNDSPGAENAGAAYLFDGDPASGEYAPIRLNPDRKSVV